MTEQPPPIPEGPEEPDEQLEAGQGNVKVRTSPYRWAIYAALGTTLLAVGGIGVYISSQLLNKPLRGPMGAAVTPRVETLPDYMNDKAFITKILVMHWRSVPDFSKKDEKDIRSMLYDIYTRELHLYAFHQSDITLKQRVLDRIQKRVARDREVADAEWEMLFSLLRDDDNPVLQFQAAVTFSYAHRLADEDKTLSSAIEDLTTEILIAHATFDTTAYEKDARVRFTDDVSRNLHAELGRRLRDWSGVDDEQRTAQENTQQALDALGRMVRNHPSALQRVKELLVGNPGSSLMQSMPIFIGSGMNSNSVQHHEAKQFLLDLFAIDGLPPVARKNVFQACLIAGMNDPDDIRIIAQQALQHYATFAVMLKDMDLMPPPKAPNPFVTALQEILQAIFDAAPGLEAKVREHLRID